MSQSLCNSSNVFFLSLLFIPLQRLGRFFRAVCSGWQGFYLPLTPLPSWADRGWPAPSLPSPWSALWPVSLTQNNSGIKQNTGVISYILKKFWPSDSIYFLCSSTLNEAMKNVIFCNLPQDVTATKHQTTTAPLAGALAPQQVEPMWFIWAGTCQQGQGCRVVSPLSLLQVRLLSS